MAVCLATTSCRATSPSDQAGPITSPTLTTQRSSTTAASTSDQEVTAEVVSVTDGDTVRVLLPDGTNVPVRLIGIDAPEDGSLLDREATTYLEELILGEQVLMVVDVSETDRFGRLLRYLYVGDLFVNEEMVRAGLAIAKRFPPDTAMAAVLEAAQSGAEAAALGLFSAEPTTTTTATTATTTTTTAPPTTTVPTTTTAPPTTSTAPPQTTAPPAANCHPSYPDFCIPPPPPDLNCGDIGAKDFTVLAPDPHGFDGNSDGVGCES